MTESSPSRPVPVPPRAQDVPAWSRDVSAPRQDDDGAPATAGDGRSGERQPFSDLDQLPVAEHVAVFEAEHARLHDELSTIDRL